MEADVLSYIEQINKKEGDLALLRNPHDAVGRLQRTLEIVDLAFRFIAADTIGLLQLAH